MTDEQLLEYRRVKLLRRDKQISELIAVNIKLREDLREGISLRDHFACAAMQEFIALNKFKTSLVIDMAYVMADAMLNERSKRDG